MFSCVFTDFLKIVSTHVIELSETWEPKLKALFFRGDSCVLLLGAGWILLFWSHFSPLWGSNKKSLNQFPYLLLSPGLVFWSQHCYVHFSLRRLCPFSLLTVHVFFSVHRSFFFSLEMSFTCLQAHWCFKTFVCFNVTRISLYWSRRLCLVYRFVDGGHSWFLF